MSFASDQPCLLLVAHGTLDDFRSYLTIWNISSPSQPQHVLVTSGYVRSVCFSPTKASMAFAGMMDGSISVWDLRESYTLHQVSFRSRNLADLFSINNEFVRWLHQSRISNSTFFQLANWEKKTSFGPIFKQFAFIRTNVLNNVTAAQVSVFFSAASCKKGTENGAAVTSLRTFVRSNDFKWIWFVLNVISWKRNHSEMFLHTKGHPI